jgi:hypothetical protein
MPLNGLSKGDQAATPNQVARSERLHNRNAKFPEAAEAAEKVIHIPDRRRYRAISAINPKIMHTRKIRGLYRCLTFQQAEKRQYFY